MPIKSQLLHNYKTSGWNVEVSNHFSSSNKHSCVPIVWKIPYKITFLKLHLYDKTNLFMLMKYSQTNTQFTSAVWASHEGRNCHARLNKRRLWEAFKRNHVANSWGSLRGEMSMHFSGVESHGGHEGHDGWGSSEEYESPVGDNNKQKFPRQTCCFKNFVDGISMSRETLEKK